MADLEFVIEKGKLVGYNGTGADLVIPDGVTAIGENVFKDNKTLTSVRFPEGMTEIGSDAFRGCTSLERVYIPKSVNRFDSAAFMDSGVKAVYITDLAAWCDAYFSYATANPLGCGADLYLNGELVEDLVIPDGIKSISSAAFERCRSIRSVTIADSVTEIWDSFESCSRLEVVRFGNGLTFISGAFKYCKNIKEVHIDSLEDWCKILFNCWADETPLCSGATLYIGGEAVVDLYIPDHIKKIGKNAFAGCKTLRSVSFPEDFDIDYDAFKNCSRLRTMEFRGDGNFDSYAFEGCNGLLVIKLYSGFRIPLWNVLVEHTKAKYIGTDDRLVEVGDFRFFETYEGNYLYEYLGDGEEVILPDSYKGKSYGIASDTFAGKSIRSVRFPEGAIKEIETGAFAYCNSLTEITIPAGVNMENKVFIGCKNLEKVTAYSPVGYFAFENCDRLTLVEIAEGVCQIKPFAFQDCVALKEITVPASVEFIGNGAFLGCEGLERVAFADTSDWRTTDSYTAYDYRRVGGEPIDFTDPAANAARILADKDDMYYFKPVKN